MYTPSWYPIAIVLRTLASQQDPVAMVPWDIYLDFKYFITWTCEFFFFNVKFLIYLLFF